MKNLPRLPHPEDCRDPEMQLFRQMFIATDERTRQYNCLGSCLGVRAWLGSPAGPAYLEQKLGCQHLDEPSETGTTIALYMEDPAKGHREMAERMGLAAMVPTEGDYHVAKRLRDDWYESKCGAGLRIVHRRLDACARYGTFLGYWFLDEPTRFRAIALLEEEEDLIPVPYERIEDSAQVFGDRLWSQIAELETGR